MGKIDALAGFDWAIKRLLRNKAELCLAALLLPLITACKTRQVAMPASPDRSIVVLYENDVHCDIEGYPRLAGLRDAVSDTAWCALVSCGDYLQGGTAGAISKGQYVADVLRNMQYDAVTLGNHEFDYGYEQLKENLSKASFKVLCADVLDSTGKTIYDANAVYTTKSGLQYKIVKKGNGVKPKATDKVRVHYTGTLIDGTKFDSSVDRGMPAEFPLNQVIPGWTEGLQLMDVGSKYILYIPHTLGYGTNPTGSIPPGSTLIFEVELLDIVK